MEVEKQGERKAGCTDFGQLYSEEETAAGMALWVFVCVCVCVCVCVHMYVCVCGERQRSKVAGQC